MAGVHWGDWSFNLGTPGPSSEGCHEEARACGKGRLLLTTQASVLNWEHKTLFLEIRNYSMNQDLLSFYIKAILVTSTDGPVTK